MFCILFFILLYYPSHILSSFSLHLRTTMLGFNSHPPKSFATIQTLLLRLMNQFKKKQELHHISKQCKVQNTTICNTNQYEKKHIRKGNKNLFVTRTFAKRHHWKRFSTMMLFLFPLVFLSPIVGVEDTEVVARCSLHFDLQIYFAIRSNSHSFLRFSITFLMRVSNVIFKF